jgi:hypothetical protein
LGASAEALWTTTGLRCLSGSCSRCGRAIAGASGASVGRCGGGIWGESRYRGSRSEGRGATACPLQGGRGGVHLARAGTGHQGRRGSDRPVGRQRRRAVGHDGNHCESASYGVCSAADGP